MEKEEDIPPVSGTGIAWATNLTKNKNAFVNLHEFNRGDYKMSFLYPVCLKCFSFCKSLSLDSHVNEF